MMRRQILHGLVELGRQHGVSHRVGHVRSRRDVGDTGPSGLPLAIEALAVVVRDVPQDLVQPRPEAIVAGAAEPVDVLERALEGFLDDVLDRPVRTERPPGLCGERVAVVVDDDGERVGVVAEMGLDQ